MDAEHGDNIATHPLLTALIEYGRRSEGDQMRMTKDGPRPLAEGDYHPDGRVKRVANPPDQVTRATGQFESVTTPDKMEWVRAVLEHRGRHLKGKARPRGDSANPLGGRIYDLTCG